MATPIYDLISNASLGLISVGNAQIKKERHHELVLPVKASATTNFLKFLDPQFSCYNIPLGEAPTRKKDQASKQNNILIPILPLCYTTPDCDPINARSPRAGGYLYIYIGDYLWRELEVFKDGKFRDINLHQYQGKDLRPATVEQDTRILIPHMVDGKENTVTMCYSEIQWSWARINTMGGMDPDDFRLDVDTPPTLASDMNISKATAAKNRAARMQELNLSGYLTGFPNTAATGNKARVENSNNPTSSLYYLSLHKKSEIPIVYLHDPLGIALDNTKKYFNAHAKLFSEVEQIKTQEHFKTAVITYQSFFNEDLWEQGMEEGAGSSSLLDDDDDPGFEQSDPNSVVFRKSAGTLDKDYIKKYLKVDSRKPLRQKIRESKKQHVEFLDAKFGGKDLTATNPDFVSVNDALLDYAELPPPSYVVLWSAVNSLISFLNYDPSILDAALDVPQDQDRLKKTEDPGCLYMESLLKPAHPLHAVLFPKKADVNEFVKDYDIDGKKVELPNGTGDFRPIAFATSFTTQFNKSVGSWVYFESTLKQLDKSLSDFATAFKTQWTQSLQQTTSYDANVIIRLFKAANLSELDGLHILIKDQPLQGVTPMTGNVTVLSTMMTSIQSKSFSRQKMKNGINVVDPKTSKIVGYLDPHQVPNFKGTPMDITLEKFNDLFTKAEGSTKTARMQLTVVSSSSKYATEWHANFSGSITETIEVEKTPSGIKFAG
ncbi:MAG: toxin VasX, partial [Thiohalomonadales bacterium]